MACVAQDHIGTAAADEGIIQSVARCVDIPGSTQDKILHISRKRIAHGGLNDIYSLACVFHNKIADRVHHIGIISCATDHAIVAGTAIQPIVSGMAHQAIVSARA